MKKSESSGSDKLKRIFYAHSDPKNPGKLPEEGANWHLLKDHLEETAQLAKQFASAFNAADWGYVAGLLHDLGKYSNEFQEYLRNSCDLDAHIEQRKGKIDHSTAGAQKVNNDITQIGKLLAYCISGHHSGLLDGSGNNGSTLSDRLAKTVPEVQYFDKLPAYPSLKPPFTPDAKRMGFQLFIFVKMLYSSLVDADFLNTELFRAKDKFRYRSNFPELLEIAERFRASMTKLKQATEDSQINQKRDEIYRDCLNAAELEPGLFSLTVPTGGGKTLSSMAFALRHAIKYGLKRIIYVIPFTSIIEQNADVFRGFLGKDAVLEHHSNFEPEQEDHRTRLASENWDAPVIVTTTVQFYESFFANRSSKCRKLHNIAESVIILDEVQNLPVEYLRPCIELLRELSLNYRCSIVLCSATQPAIQYREDFKSGLIDVREISASPQYLTKKLKRVEVTKIPENTKIEIAERMNNHSQVLCIVNRKKDARQLYESLDKGESNIHLSTLMCPEHRREKLKLVKELLKTQRECRVVSTQLIEAGVDIDFPVVYRAMAGLDSIAQAAGRCNREGKLDKGQVFVFEPDNGYPPGHITITAQEAIGVIRRTEGDILSLEAIEEYFKNLYWIREQELDSKKIIESIRAGTAKLNFPFKSISEKFQLIEHITQPVIIPYNDKANELIKKLEYVEFPGKIMRQLQPYTVQIHTCYWGDMVNCGAVQVVADMFPVLQREDLYDENLGLNINSPDEYKPETLII